MSGSTQLECRVVITHQRGGRTFSLGMYDPLHGRYEPLGTHPTRDIEHIVRGLRERIEREGHLVSFSEQTGGR